MAEEKKEKWLNYLAITTVIIAVCATLSTFKGGGFSTRSVLAQSQASDQWAYFQAKSIKGYLYELQKERFELELMAGKLPDPVAREYRNKIAFYNEKLARYKAEKDEIEKVARDLEKKRDEAQSHAQSFGMAVIFLQIAILLSSISALMKKKTLWIIGLLVALIGVFYFANGFLMFLR